MKLYYSPGACSLADHIALAETGLSYELAKVDLKAKQIEGGGDYLQINPKGYVPALDIGEGTIVTENIAILSYLADRVDDFMPADGISHIRGLELLAFISTELHKNFKPYFNPAASEAEKDEAAQMLGKRFGYVAEVLGTKPFLMGDTLSMPDCYLYVMLRWAAKNELALPEALTAFVDRMTARPAVQKALAEEGLD